VRHSSAGYLYCGTGVALYRARAVSASALASIYRVWSQSRFGALPVRAQAASCLGQPVFWPRGYAAHVQCAMVRATLKIAADVAASPISPAPAMFKPYDWTWNCPVRASEAELIWR
jgi:hypothetical protein